MSDEDDIYGPALPPNFKEAVYGPTLPIPSDSTNVDSSAVDPDLIGPMPPELALHDAVRHLGSSSSKKRSHKSANETNREEWMLVPPKVLKDSGLSARGFKGSKKLDLDSYSNKVWTKVAGAEDSESDNEKETAEELKLREDAEMVGTKRRDAQLKEVADQLSEERSKETLLQQHQRLLEEKVKKPLKKSKKHKKEKKSKKSKKKKKKKSSSSSSSDDVPVPTRVPFDRERDLKVVSLDTKRKLLSNSSSFLTSQFGHGKQQFL